MAVSWPIFVYFIYLRQVSPIKVTTYLQSVYVCRSVPFDSVTQRETAADVRVLNYFPFD